jgi:hypothetical protein
VPPLLPPLAKKNKKKKKQKAGTANNTHTFYAVNGVGRPKNRAVARTPIQHNVMDALMSPSVSYTPASSSL